MNIYTELKLILNKDDFDLVAGHLETANFEFNEGSKSKAAAELRASINLLIAFDKCKAAGNIYSYLKYCE